MPVLEKPDYLGAGPQFHGNDDPLRSQGWEKSPRLDPEQIGLEPRHDNKDLPPALRVAAVALGVVAAVLGGDD